MIFRSEFLKLIKQGKIKIAYRRWTKMSVKVGGTLKTPIGVLKFSKIEPVDEKKLDLKKAKAAGYESLEALHKDLNFKKEGTVYKLNFKLIGEDPRLALREITDKLDKVFASLERLDRASIEGPWTKKTLKLLEKYPAIGARILAAKIDFDMMKFKLNVRKLKNLGLTISLGTGYKLSPRGKAVLKKLK